MMVEKHIRSKKTPLIRAFCIKSSVYPGPMKTGENSIRFTSKIKYQTLKMGDQVLINDFQFKTLKYPSSIVNKISQKITNNGVTQRNINEIIKLILKIQ